jgi:hypothetical protein
MAKRLADFPLGDWVKAADRCPDCDGTIWVKVNYVAKDGNYGHVTTKTEHKEGCASTMFDYPRCLVVETDDFAGWEYSNIEFNIGGVVVTAYKARSNLALCSRCGGFVVGVPLILFPKNGEYELDFCDDCVKELNLLDRIVKPHTEDEDTVDYNDVEAAENGIRQEKADAEYEIREQEAKSEEQARTEEEEREREQADKEEEQAWREGGPPF